MIPNYSEKSVVVFYSIRCLSGNGFYHHSILNLNMSNQRRRRGGGLIAIIQHFILHKVSFLLFYTSENKRNTNNWRGETFTWRWKLSHSVLKTFQILDLVIENRRKTSKKTGKQTSCHQTFHWVWCSLSCSRHIWFRAQLKFRLELRIW